MDVVCVVDCGFRLLAGGFGLGLAGLRAVSGCLVVLVWFSRVVVLIALIVDFGCEFCVILAFELVLLSEFPTGGLGVLGCLLFWGVGCCEPILALWV